MHIIVITGRPLNDARDLALQKGALELLQKPFSKESLMELVNKVEYEKIHGPARPG
jgi:FixJ family two-component response regulator